MRAAFAEGLAIVWKSALPEPFGNKLTQLVLMLASNHTEFKGAHLDEQAIWRGVGVLALLPPFQLDLLLILGLPGSQCCFSKQQGTQKQRCQVIVCHLQAAFHTYVDIMVKLSAGWNSSSNLYCLKGNKPASSYLSTNIEGSKHLKLAATQFG